MYRKTIITDFFTTVSLKQFLYSLYLLTLKLPFLRTSFNTTKFEKLLLKYLWVKESWIVSFYNARSAIFHTIKMLWLKNTDEVIVSWYTCISVINSVIQSWARVVYCDINKEDLWLNTTQLKKKISKDTKLIIVQHTFGKSSDINWIIKVAKEKGVLVMEDCAHSLWSELNSRKLWTYWDFAIFSTWRDKVISSVTWWFLVINNPQYLKKAEKIRKILILPSRFLIIRNHYYNLVWYKAYKFYSFLWLWKVLIYLSRKFKLITEILTQDEKNCDFNEFNYKYPWSLAYLAIKELNNVEKYYDHRKKIAQIYNKYLEWKYDLCFKIWFDEKVNYFRYPMIYKDLKEKEKFIWFMKENSVILWTSWSWTNIAPIWSNIKNAHYIKWECPKAEEVWKTILTLPNHKLLNEKDIKRIIKLIDKFHKTNA